MDGTIALTLIEALLILLALLISKAIRFISPSLYGNQPVAVDESSKDDVILTQTVSPPPPSHIVVSHPATKYDVFLSFRGEDTRHTFASYLYNGLRKASIRTFMDHELRKGEQISPVLLRTIEKSKICVIIFSESYASSTWCMNELVHILKCKEDYGRVVIPIFYEVDPSNIRKQNGNFGKGFDVLKQRFKDNQEQLQKWRNALIQSTSLSGWDSNTIRPELKLVEEIVKDTLSRLKYESSSHLEGLIGIAPHIENIKKRLREARIVGIWGMGGAGKTTLAKALFHELKAQFDAFSFIENVKEQLKRVSWDELQQHCLKELLKDEDISIYDIRSTFVKSRLRLKKILVILDDVDNSKIADDLSKVFDWFGEESRIIITSRDMQVLKNASAFSTYHIPRLDFYDAFHLFNLNAFKQYEPSKGYMELSKSVVKYCHGNPLALVVLGCFLYGRGKEEWESCLEKLNQAPPVDIFDVLKLSFDGLDENQKNMFLDVAFFIKERVEVSLDLISGLYGSSVYIDISVLNDRSLTSFAHNGYIKLHDLVRDMGVEIARQQSFSNPKCPVRLRSRTDICDFFISKKAGIEAVRCVSLDVSKMKRMITWRASDFRKMYNLIFLKVYKSDGRKSLKLNLVGHLDYLPEELRFLSWEGYQLPYVPLHFCAENLVTLEMRNSNIQQLGNGSQHFPNLKKIDLSFSKDLSVLPDLSDTPKIENMYLYGCESLAQIHYSSKVSGRNVALYIQNGRPLKMNIENRFTMKGPNRSEFEIVRNYSDVGKLSLNKATIHGKIMSDVEFKHVEMPLEMEKTAELRKGRQRLADLLPYVWRVEWSESPIDFTQHYTYNLHYSDPYYSLRRDDFTQVGRTTTSMECCDSNNTVTLTRHPSSITPDRLLSYHPLDENIPPFLILKALDAIPPNYCCIKNPPDCIINPSRYKWSGGVGPHSLGNRAGYRYGYPYRKDLQFA